MTFHEGYTPFKNAPENKDSDSYTPEIQVTHIPDRLVLNSVCPSLQVANQAGEQAILALSKSNKPKI